MGVIPTVGQVMGQQRCQFLATLLQSHFPRSQCSPWAMSNGVNKVSHPVSPRLIRNTSSPAFLECLNDCFWPITALSERQKSVDSRLNAAGKSSQGQRTRLRITEHIFNRGQTRRSWLKCSGIAAQPPPHIFRSSTQTSGLRVIMPMRPSIRDMRYAICDMRLLQASGKISLIFVEWVLYITKYFISVAMFQKEVQ